MRSADVVVVGAGPAGAAAAITLARAGRDGDRSSTRRASPRQVLRRRPDHRAPCACSRSSGSTRPRSPSWQRGRRRRGALAVGPRGRRFPLPRGAGHVRGGRPPGRPRRRARRPGPRRGRQGARRARRAPARRADGDRVVARASRASARSQRPLRRRRRRHVVAGAQARSAPATPGYLGEWHAFRQYFTDVGPAAARDLWVWFEPDLLPGYAWSFPLPGGAGQRRLRHPAGRLGVAPGT